MLTINTISDYWYTWNLMDNSRIQVGLITGTSEDNALKNINERHPNRTNILFECPKNVEMINKKRKELYG